MIVIKEIEQGTPEWYQLRIGIPTASNFDRIITSTGKPSKQAEEYAYELAAERLSGTLDGSGFQSKWMARGKEVEAEARDFFRLVTDLELEEVCFVFKDEAKQVGCSPDMLGDGFGLELKCPMGKNHLKYLEAGKLPTEYVCQVQGSMFVTGFDSWYFMSYFPGIKPLILEIKRDQEFMDRLKEGINGLLDRIKLIETRAK